MPQHGKTLEEIRNADEAATAPAHAYAPCPHGMVAAEDVMHMVLCLHRQIMLPADVCEQFNRLVAHPSVAPLVKKWNESPDIEDETRTDG